MIEKAKPEDIEKMVNDAEANEKTEALSKKQKMEARLKELTGEDEKSHHKPKKERS